MASRIYVTPDPLGSLQTFDVPYGLTDFQVRPVKVTGAALMPGGGTTYSVDGGFDRVRIVVERRSQRLASLFAWRDKCHSLIDHLQRGGRIGFAQDADKAVLGSLNAFPLGSSVQFTSNLYSSWEPTAALAVDDRVVLSSALPDRKREEHTVASRSAGPPVTIGLDRAVWFRHGSGPWLLRHHGFYPCLRLDPDARSEDLCVSERGLVFTLSLPLVEDLATLDSEVESGEVAILGTGDSDGALGPRAFHVRETYSPDRSDNPSVWET